MTINFQERFKERNVEWVEIATQLWEVKKQLKHYCEMEENLLILLKEASFNEPSKAGDFMFDAIERKGNIDYTSIPALKFMNLEPFRKPSGICWKLSKI